MSGGLAAEISGGDLIKGFTTGVIVSAFNHWAHEAAEGGGGSKDSPKCGDKAIIDGGHGGFMEVVYTGDGPLDGWQIVRVVPGSGAIQVTDSPIEWVLGAWKTPLKAVDDIGVLGFARVPKGEAWIDIASGKIQQAGTFLKEGGAYLKLLKNKIKTDFSKTTTSRGKPSAPDLNYQAGSKWAKAMELFGELFSPK